MISEKIVIVDDDLRIHQSLEKILFEYQLISFTDAEKALKYLQGPNEASLVLVDVCMAGLNGIELLEKLRKTRKDIAVMMITAHANQGIVVDAMRLHADDFVEKPFDIDELKDRVRVLLKERSPYRNVTEKPKSHVERIRWFIERNYTNASLEHMAKELCLSPQYLSRFFSKHNKQGFRGYKLQVRMEKAKQLLSGSTLDVSEIAYQLGYENPESFMRAFKRTINETPSAYRSAHQQKARRKS